jgi:ATP-dependent Lhr-like helicase
MDTQTSTLDLFHPAVGTWFSGRFGAPTDPQTQAWPSIRAGRHTLIAAPTGSGKTLAAFLAAIDDLVRRSLLGDLEETVQVVYVSPLKALSNDIEKNLVEPLSGIERELAALGLPAAGIRTLVRTGDTPASVRAAMIKRPPHILVTTPESLFILLTSDSGRRMLQTTRTVIVDEIHAVADDKRGSHLALSLERLEALVGTQGRRLSRVGLSATQRPIEEVARFLVGSRDGVAEECTIVDVGHRRAMDLGIEVPGSPLEAVMSAETWQEVYDRIAELIRAHGTTLVFTNTRRLAERAARFLEDRLGEGKVATHHGSLSKEKRLEAERRLKAGELKALVATASLELGIDIGSVDLVCQIASTRSIATFLQRVGRSGHHLAGLPKARIFPTTRDELIECAALVDAARRGELDRLIIPQKPLDILAQQIVAATAAEEWKEDDLYATFRRAYPYRDLERKEFDEVVEMLGDGFTTRRGRRGAYLHHDAVNGRLRARKGARIAAITSGGAIPDTGDYRVVLEPSESVVGTVNEDFAVESMPGDVFQLGNASWQILKVEPGRVLVADAKGQPPSIPFWLGEAPGRTDELSVAVSRLRETVQEKLDPEKGGSLAAAQSWLVEELGLPREAARQIADYLATAYAALGTLPTRTTLVAERFFDEAGDMHLVLHSPFGSRINRAWGLALRKRFCRTFNFELQAAASEDAIVLSLGPTHSFPLEDVFKFLHSSSAEDVLVQALLDAPVFGVRWRWNAGRALALLRFRGGRKVPPRLQRQESEDLIAVVFPDQLACLENIVGEREIPEHPLIQQTIHDCLTEAMDVHGLLAILRSIEAGEVELVARDLTEPSPLAHEIINGPVYTFLDDAPLEERRTQAIHTRRFADPATASDLGALDPDAIERVRTEAWPEVENADELHDALSTVGFLTAEEGERSQWQPYLKSLAAEGRAGVLTAAGPSAIGTACGLWVATERLPQVNAVYSGREIALQPVLTIPPRFAARAWTPEEALVELIRGRLQTLGPVTPKDLAASLGLPVGRIDGALAALEGEGFAMRGHFTSPKMAEIEWCERRLLARIHRLTLDRLRKEIEPVAPADFLRFLFAWQRVTEPGEGPESTAAVLAQLEGFEAAAAAWEGEILPARVAKYEPAWLDSLCLAGRYVWGRVSVPPAPEGRRSGPVKATPLALLGRSNLGLWREVAPGVDPRELPLSGSARAVYDHLAKRGASFFGEIGASAGLLHTQVEEALSELVAWGLATADSFTGLRALLVPANRRPPLQAVGGGMGSRRRGRVSVFGMENAGRWSLLHAPSTLPAEGAKKAEPQDPSDEAIETVAWTLLARYGVVFRRLLERETLLPPWRDLLWAFRRLEARGEIRGGRFVSGFSGEQYAMIEAVGKLRALRREPRKGSLVTISAADPLNLVGILTPGPRLAALAGNRILFKDGIPIAIHEGKETSFLIDMDAAARWQAHTALVRRPVVPELQAYLGKSA